MSLIYRKINKHQTGGPVVKPSQGKETRDKFNKDLGKFDKKLESAKIDAKFFMNPKGKKKYLEAQALKKIEADKKANTEAEFREKVRADRKNNPGRDPEVLTPEQEKFKRDRVFKNTFSEKELSLKERRRRLTAKYTNDQSDKNVAEAFEKGRVQREAKYKAQSDSLRIRINEIMKGMEGWKPAN